MLTDVLLEIGVEELPSGSVKLLGQSLLEHIKAGLDLAHISYGTARYFASPRRLAVYLTDVQDRQATQKVMRRGPACDAQQEPSKALLGFAASCGVDITQLTQMTTDKGSWWMYESESVVQATQDLLPDIIRHAIRQLPIVRLMRWGMGEVEFVRPVHWIVLLWGDAVIETTILGVPTGRCSFGHRFHHPQAIRIPAPSHYEALLKEAFVLADFDARRQMIVETVQTSAAQYQSTAVMPDALVDEVTSIVEWPSPLVVPFDSAFLAIPSEVLIAAMQGHQKCFALRDKNTQLQPYFITVANIQSTQPPRVIKGNEQVMHARLSDAAFFYQQDRKKSLSEYFEETQTVVLRKGLGSLADQALRLQSLMHYLADVLGLDVTYARRAAWLNSCDLMTGMVGEFPELQGLMGYYYAKNDGEALDVAQALQEQYFPRFSSDTLPPSLLGLALSIAQRVDTLVGSFALGQKPSGVKDPFKLRRHALALARLLIAAPVSLSLSMLLRQSCEIYGDLCTDPAMIIREIKTFIGERLLSFYQTQEITAEVVQAVRAKEDDVLRDMDQRIHALVCFKSKPEATALIAVCKRVRHLLQPLLLSGMIDNPSETQRRFVHEALFQDVVENNLFSSLCRVELEVDACHRRGAYEDVLLAVSSLQKPVDQFFEHVLVMVDDESIKNNRLCLLARVQDVLQHVADMSLL